MRTVWITGAGKGIGRAVAWHYAKAGWQVAASARTAEDLARLGADAAAAKLPGRIVAFPHDVADGTAVAAAAAAVERACGLPDHVIFNAGTYIPNEATSFTAGPFATMLSINFMGTVHGLEAVLPRMLARRAGRIGVMASVAGYNGLAGASAYGATKAAMINMCEALRVELDGTGVVLSVINPGFVKTPLSDKNTFHMPFLLEPEYAAARIFDGMQTDRFEIAFPRLFVLMLKLVKILPYAVSLPLVRKITRSS
jgi:NAD(P)-dependent dehydrogenase (short-subunit alcohol dehydrogenase family)